MQTSPVQLEMFLFRTCSVLEDEGDLYPFARTQRSWSFVLGCARCVLLRAQVRWSWAGGTAECESAPAALGESLHQLSARGSSRSHESVLYGEPKPPATNWQRRFKLRLGKKCTGLRHQRWPLQRGGGAAEITSLRRRFPAQSTRIWGLPGKGLETDVEGHQKFRMWPGKRHLFIKAGVFCTAALSCAVSGEEIPEQT